MKQKYTSLNSFAIFVILGIFGIISLFVIILGAGFYKNVGKTSRDTDSIRVGFNYISNKLRFSNIEETVLTEFSGIKVIRLSMENYYDCIYFYDGYIMELPLTDNTDFVPLNGERIIPAQQFDFSKNGSLLELVIQKDQDSRSFSTCIALPPSQDLATDSIYKENSRSEQSNGYDYDDEYDLNSHNTHPRQKDITDSSSFSFSYPLDVYLDAFPQ